MTNWKMTNEPIRKTPSESSSDHTTIGGNTQISALITSCMLWLQVAHVSKDIVDPVQHDVGVSRSERQTWPEKGNCQQMTIIII